MAKQNKIGPIDTKKRDALDKEIIQYFLRSQSLKKQKSNVDKELTKLISYILPRDFIIPNQKGVLLFQVC